MAVNDAGRRRKQAAHGAHRGLELGNAARVEPFEIGDAVRFGVHLQALERRDFVVAARDDEFTETTVRNVVLRAVLVKKRLAAHARDGLLRLLRVIDACVNDLGIARARVRTENRLGFEHQHRAPRERERTPDREPDDSGTDDRHVHAFAHDAHERED